MKIFNIHIMTTKQRNELIDESIDESFESAKSVEWAFRFTTLNPVVHSLKKLRANTWDVDMVDKMISLIEDYINRPKTDYIFPQGQTLDKEEYSELLEFVKNS